MSEPPIVVLRDPAPVIEGPAPALGRVAAGGFAWSVGLSLVAKVGTLVGQIALARLLVPQDYAVVSLAVAMAVIPNVLRDGGATQVLVQRQRSYADLANAAFWMSLALGGAATLLIAVTAPLAAWFYGYPVLVNLLLILAATAAVNAVSVVPQARLQIDLRFRAGAILGTAGQILTVVLSVVMARLGYGPVALIAPLFFVAAGRAVVLWVLAPAPVRRTLDVRRWRLFFVNGGLLMAQSLVWSVTVQGDYAILGYFGNKDALGYYVFAFGLSMQTVQLMGSTLTGVMFPTLSRIKSESGRQRNAIIDASFFSGIVMLPIGLFPIVCPRAIIQLLFGERWLPSATLLQVLSVAAALASLGIPMGSYLMAQGRNKANFFFSLAAAVFFGVTVFVFTWAYGATGTAAAVCVCQFFQTVGGLYLVLSPGGPAGRIIARVIGVPLLLSTAATLATAAAVHLTPIAHLRPLSLIVIALVVQGALYFAIISVFANSATRRLMSMVTPLLRRRSS